MLQQAELSRPEAGAWPLGAGRHCLPGLGRLGEEMAWGLLVLMVAQPFEYEKPLNCGFKGKFYSVRIRSPFPRKVHQKLESQAGASHNSQSGTGGNPGLGASNGQSGAPRPAAQ